MTRLVVWGAGELGGRVASRWQQGPAVGFTRSTNRHSTLQAAGVDARIGCPVGDLSETDVFLLAVPGHVAQLEAIAQLQSGASVVPARAILVSSTGYYGPSASGALNESSLPGKTDRARAIANTEDCFRQWCGDLGVVIRFGGLYRPGRGPISALARRGTVLLQPPNMPLPLIHYDDAATAVIAALTLPAVEHTYLGITLPAPTKYEYYTAACQQRGLPAPSFAEPVPIPPEYDTAYFTRDLLSRAVYPDWHEALRMI